MNYHNITYPDMNNGDGLRVVLWLSGCSHHCYNCQNPQTWNPNSGILFDDKAEEELFRELGKDYISGITFTGGDPLHENNLGEVLRLADKFRVLFPEKIIWLYTGYLWNQIMFPVVTDNINLKRTQQVRKDVLQLCDVLIDGKYIDAERDVTLKWRGSKNQKVIDVQKSLQNGEIVLWTD